MRKRKEFYVVAYDIASSRQRRKFSQILEKYGRRINKSVFECLASPAELYAVRCAAHSLIDVKKDSVVFYSLCIDCFAKAEYVPEVKRDISIVKILA